MSPLHICGCTGTTLNINLLHLTRTHLLLAGNDTVPISVGRSSGMHSIGYRLLETEVEATVLYYNIAYSVQPFVFISIVRDALMYISLPLVLMHW